MTTQTIEAMNTQIMAAIKTAAQRLTNAPRKQGFSFDPTHGGAIHYYMSGAEHEAIECGVNSLSVIKIVLKDVDGREIDPKGGHWRATLIFDN